MKATINNKIMSQNMDKPGLYLIHGYFGTGKALLALKIAIACAVGSKPAKVLFVNGELWGRELKDYLKAVLADMNLESKPLPKIRFMTSLHQPPGKIDLSTRPWLKMLEEFVISDDVQLIVLNNVGTLCHSKQGRLKAWCLKMRDEGKAVFVIREDYRGKKGLKTFRADNKDLFDVIIQMPQCTFTRKREALMKNDRLVVLPLNEFLKLDFGKKSKRKIYQRCPRDGGPIFWDTYLHPECVEVEPERIRR